MFSSNIAQLCFHLKDCTKTIRLCLATASEICNYCHLLQSKPRARPASKRKNAELDFDVQEEEEEAQRQCYGPGCIEHARPNSKYCSEECGMKQATK